jgi:phosphohistidine phosphatase SixA
VASDLIEPAVDSVDRGSRLDMLLVVRHADAGDKRSWTGPDALRPLSSAGRRQAEGLVVRLEDYPVDRILCGPTVRCHETVQPLAHDRFLEIEHITALGWRPPRPSCSRSSRPRSSTTPCCAPTAS